MDGKSLTAALTTLVLCVLQLCPIFLVAEGYRLQAAPNVNFGEIAKIYYIYNEPKYKGSSAHLRIESNGNEIYKCTIPSNRGKAVKGNTEGIQEDPQYVENYQIIEMPTDFISFNLNAAMPVAITISVVPASAKTAVVHSMYVQAPFIDAAIFKTAVEVSDANRKGEAKKLLKEALPKVARQQAIQIEVKNAQPKYTYRLVLHRINLFGRDLCPLDNLAGKIDLAEYNSLEALCPCELDMNRTSMTIGPFMMPHGYIRISVLVENKGQLLYDCRRYFEVETPNLVGLALPFYDLSKPLPTLFSWAVGKDIHIDASKAFFPFLTTSYGVHPDFPVTPQFVVRCSGDSHVCKNLNYSADYHVRVPKDAVAKTFVSKTDLTISLHWDYLEGKRTLEGRVIKNINIEKNSLIVDIVCIRNCGLRYALGIPAVMMVTCKSCQGFDVNNFDYEWEGSFGTEPPFVVRSKYLTIEAGKSKKESSLFLEVTVKYKQIVRTNGTTKASSKPDLIGHARATIKTASNSSSVKIVPTATRKAASANSSLSDIYDFDLDIDQMDSAVTFSPISLFFRVSSKVPQRRVDVCSFVKPIQNVALFLPQDGSRLKGFVGIRTADGLKYEKPVWLTTRLTNQTISKVKSVPFVKRCKATLNATTSGLSSLVALAQEIFDSGYSETDIVQCYESVKHKLLGEDIYPARYEDSFSIQYLFFIKSYLKRNLASVIEALDNMNLTKRFIFEKTTQNTQDLKLFTEWYLKAVTEVLIKPPKLPYGQISSLEEDLRHRIENDSMAMLRLYEKRDNILIFRVKSRYVYLVWTDFSDKKFTVDITYKSNWIEARINVPRQVFLETLALYNSTAKHARKDNFVNVMVTISNRVVHKKSRLNHGYADMFTELKSTHQAIKLQPKKQPIELTFRRRLLKRKVQEIPMDIVEENGKVIDSTCAIFSISRSDRFNLTLRVDTPGKHNYSLAVIAANYPSEYLDFTEVKFKSIGNGTTYIMERVPKQHKYAYPLSRYFFMIKVEAKGGLGFGMRKAPQMQNSKTSRQQMGPGNTTGTGSNAIRKGVKLSARLFRTGCYYLVGRKWRNGPGCKVVPLDDIKVIKCNCYIHAPYAGSRHSAMKYLQKFEAQDIFYHGPTLIPTTFVLMCMAFFIFYCYWSFFQDRKEKDCAQTHIVKDMYNPRSLEQYLVCISTGAMPGSGTDNRVSFLLVGETGSFQTVMPEGRFCFSTGSEVWLLLSSNLKLGHITGVTVHYDKIVNGTELNPWYLKRVMVYSYYFNYVIVFEANQTLGIHLPSLVLPTVPHKDVWGGETFLRFWRIMKAYHLLVSVIFHVPGKGANRCQSAIASLTVIMAASALAVEIIGPPKPVYHKNTLVALDRHGYMRAIAILSTLTFCLSLLVKSLYALVFRKPVGVVWYNKPHPEEGDLQADGPTPSKSDLTSGETWLTHKRPLREEPEVHSSWFIRSSYFPLWITRHFKSSADETAASSVDGNEDAVEPRKKSDEPNHSVDPLVPTRSAISMLGVGRSVTRFSDGSVISKITAPSKEQSVTSFANHWIKKDESGAYIVSRHPSLHNGQDKRATFAKHQLSKTTLSRTTSTFSVTNDTSTKTTKRQAGNPKLLNSNKNREDSDPEEKDRSNGRSTIPTKPYDTDNRAIHSRRAGDEATPSVEPSDYLVNCHFENTKLRCVFSENHETVNLQKLCLPSKRFEQSPVTNFESRPHGFTPDSQQDQTSTVSVFQNPSIPSSPLSNNFGEFAYDSSDEDSSVKPRHSKTKMKNRSGERIMGEHAKASTSVWPRPGEEGHGFPPLCYPASPESCPSCSTKSSHQRTHWESEHGVLSKRPLPRRKRETTHSEWSHVSGLQINVSSSDQHSQSSLSLPANESTSSLQRENRVVEFTSDPRTHGTRERHLEITSFREYYFRPIIFQGEERGMWHKAPQSMMAASSRFLRNSRYLEKLARQYDLTEVIFPISNNNEFQAFVPNEQGVYADRVESGGFHEVSCGFTSSQVGTGRLEDTSFYSDSQGGPFTSSSHVSENNKSPACMQEYHRFSSSDLDNEWPETKSTSVPGIPGVTSIWGGFVESVRRLFGRQPRFPISVPLPCACIRDAQSTEDSSLCHSFSDKCKSLSNVSKEWHSCQNSSSREEEDHGYVCKKGSDLGTSNEFRDGTGVRHIILTGDNSLTSNEKIDDSKAFSESSESPKENEEHTCKVKNPAQKCCQKLGKDTFTCKKAYNLCNMIPNSKRKADNPCHKKTLKTKEHDLCRGTLLRNESTDTIVSTASLSLVDSEMSTTTPNEMTINKVKSDSSKGNLNINFSADPPTQTESISKSTDVDNPVESDARGNESEGIEDRADGTNEKSASERGSQDGKSLTDQDRFNQVFETIGDVLKSAWVSKSFFTQIPAMIVSICVILYCCGWVCLNSTYYSFQHGMEWLVVLVAALLINMIVLEPCVFLCCAFVSSNIWRRPLIVNECLERFRGVMAELLYREWMVDLSLASRHLTSTIHHQAAPESASLFYLHDKIYKALKRVISLPDVVFHTGVYWLIFYTACTLLLVNLEADIHQARMQNAYIHNALGLHDRERHTSVEQMWDYLENWLHPGLVNMQESINVTGDPEEEMEDDDDEYHHVVNISEVFMGCMLLSPVRFKQIRTSALYKSTEPCQHFPYVSIDKKRQCNFELTTENMETRNFSFSWDHLDQQNHGGRYMHLRDKIQYFGSINLLPQSGYKELVHFDDDDTRNHLNDLRHSDWIDEHTRYLLIDFALLNPNSRIISAYQIRYDFRRSAPFWYVSSFHFRYEEAGNKFYYMIIIGLFFIVISAYNIFKELLLLYKMGPFAYLVRLSSYLEMLKVLLSFILCYVYLRKKSVTTTLLRSIKFSYESRDNPEFIDFFEMAAMDYTYSVAGGFLAFLCIFQIFLMLSKIRRLLIFIRLLIKVVTLFYMPLTTGLAFAFLSNILFGSTNESFSHFGLSYLEINQYFIRPQAIYASLTDSHPYIGPWFYFVLGFCICFFMLNFFIAFLNEAYSSIINQVRIATYKVREKTKLEYVYEFLGIRSTITWDVEEDQLQDRERDKDFLADIKRLHAN